MQARMHACMHDKFYDAPGFPTALTTAMQHTCCCPRSHGKQEEEQGRQGQETPEGGLLARVGLVHSVWADTMPPDGLQKQSTQPRFKPSKKAARGMGLQQVP